LPSAIAERVDFLAKSMALTKQDVARIVGSSPREVSRWSAGEASPQRMTKQRLLELAFIGEQLSSVLAREDANLWIFSPNQLLSGDTPAERITTGDFKTVLALIDALAEGVVT
jgi:transcriptional regulator with XRE-family HTH domain